MSVDSRTDNCYDIDTATITADRQIWQITGFNFQTVRIELIDR